LKLKKKIKINGNIYFAEEAKFNSTIESFIYFQKIVFDFSTRTDLLEEKYDFYPRLCNRLLLMILPGNLKESTEYSNI
jgi:hypothetical protein